jgi:hypothetical protein
MGVFSAGFPVKWSSELLSQLVNRNPTPTGSHNCWGVVWCLNPSGWESWHFLVCLSGFLILIASLCGWLLFPFCWLENQGTERLRNQDKVTQWEAAAWIWTLVAWLWCPVLTYSTVWCLEPLFTHEETEAQRGVTCPRPQSKLVMEGRLQLQHLAGPWSSWFWFTWELGAHLLAGLGLIEGGEQRLWVWVALRAFLDLTMYWDSVGSLRVSLLICGLEVSHHIHEICDHICESQSSEPRLWETQWLSQHSDLHWFPQSPRKHSHASLSGQSSSFLTVCALVTGQTSLCVPWQGTF